MLVSMAQGSNAKTIPSKTVIQRGDSACESSVLKKSVIVV